MSRRERVTQVYVDTSEEFKYLTESLGCYYKPGEKSFCIVKSNRDLYFTPSRKKPTHYSPQIIAYAYFKNDIRCNSGVTIIQNNECKYIIKFDDAEEIEVSESVPTVALNNALICFLEFTGLDDKKIIDTLLSKFRENACIEYINDNFVYYNPIDPDIGNLKVRRDTENLIEFRYQKEILIVTRSGDNYTIGNETFELRGVIPEISKVYNIDMTPVFKHKLTFALSNTHYKSLSIKFKKIKY